MDWIQECATESVLQLRHKTSSSDISRCLRPDTSWVDKASDTTHDRSLTLREYKADIPDLMDLATSKYLHTVWQHENTSRGYSAHPFFSMEGIPVSIPVM